MTILYTKHGTRYKPATFGEIVAGMVDEMTAAGNGSLATSIVERIISHLSKTNVSEKDVKLITHNVVEQLKAAPNAE
jgi:hypothetical protein